MEIRLQGKQNVYQNIVEEYKRLIGFGAMKYGERLPSVRALALELGVNPNTVERAYSALEEQGYIRILPKKGAYVDFADDGRRCRLEELKRQLRLLKQAGFTEAEFLMLFGEIFSEREEEKGS